MGVPFPGVALEVLRFALALQHLQEIVYTGKTWVADEALAKGLVDEATEPEALVARALEVARQLAAIPPEAFGLTKRQLRRATLERAEALAGATGADVLAAWATPETHDRIRAYLAKTVGKKG